MKDRRSKSMVGCSKMERTGCAQCHQESGKATDHVHQIDCRNTESSSASPAVLGHDQVSGHKMGTSNAKHGFSLSKAQRRSIRAEVLTRHLQRRFEAGAVAHYQLTHHVRRSLVTLPQTNKTILQGLAFLIHRKAAELALDQALKSVDRLHLKHLEDTQGFFEDYCGWYQTFCGLMSVIYKAIGVPLNRTATEDKNHS
jgi:flavin-binding protein dodecin